MAGPPHREDVEGKALKGCLALIVIVGAAAALIVLGIIHLVKG